MVRNNIFLLTLGISSKMQLEEYDLDYWYKKKYLELLESALSKEEINEKLIELNNAKEHLDQFAIDDLIRSFNEKKSLIVNVDTNQNKKSTFDNNQSFKKEIKREVTLKNKNEYYFFNRGYKKYELEDYKGTIEDFSDVLKLNPKNEDAYLYRGLSKYELDDYKGTIEDCSEVLKLNPKNEDAYLYRGYSKYVLEDNIGALNDLKKALNLNPRNEVAFHTCGYIYCRLERFVDAKNAFTKVIELNPNNDKAYANRGYAKSKLKDFHGGFEDYTKAIEINPQNDYALSNRALLKRNHFNDWEGAMEDFQKSKNLDDALNFIYKYPYESLIFFAILFITAFIIIVLEYN